MRYEVAKPEYQLMGQLAIALHSQGIQITLDALKQILQDKGFSYADGSNRGLGASVRAAYDAWVEVGANDDDTTVPAAIAHTFTGKNGQRLW